VTGGRTACQVLYSLIYYKRRVYYIYESLVFLNAFMTTDDDYYLNINSLISRIKLVELLLDIIQLHRKSHGVQKFAIICLIKLTHHNLYCRLPQWSQTRIINNVIKTLFSFINNVPVIESCLDLLCNKAWLSSCYFNKYECLKVLLSCIIHLNDESFLLNCAIEISACVLVNAERSHFKNFKKLEKISYLKKLLTVIESKMVDYQNLDEKSLILVDNILQIFNVLSEYSNETEWWRQFLTQNGLNIFCDLFQKCQLRRDDSYTQIRNRITFKAMLTIYNLSEIDKMRPFLFVHKIVEFIELFIDCDNNVNTSFIAVGFFVNFLSNFDDSNWDWKNIGHNIESKEVLTQKIDNLINKWTLGVKLLNQNEKIKFNSLTTLKNLLLNDNLTALKWSLLAISSICQYELKNNQKSFNLELYNDFIPILESVQIEKGIQTRSLIDFIIKIKNEISK
jgi:hypothetical protein